MKKFLLIAGDHYYPQARTEDWVGCFETYDDAKSMIEETHEDELFTKGPRKGQVKETRSILKLKSSGFKVDWYEIVDLDEWMNR